MFFLRRGIVFLPVGVQYLVTISKKTVDASGDRSVDRSRSLGTAGDQNGGTIVGKPKQFPAARRLLPTRVSPSQLWAHRDTHDIARHA